MTALGWVRWAACIGLMAALPASTAGSFDQRVQALMGELTIPGVAYVVLQDGKPVSRGAWGMETRTPMRVASVTKTFTAVALMRAVEAGKLSLDDSVSKWLPAFADRPQIKVRHLAAHVSEGIPGTEYVYGSSRYALLGDILAKALGTRDFAAALRDEVTDRAGLAWHESPGLGAHAALVSTVEDVATFAAALLSGQLLSQQSFNAMTTPFVSADGRALPVGVGFFSQQIGGERVVWSFGQDDPDYGSALLLMVPKRKLAVVMLASTDELSNPFRLLMGNVRTSPFATAFLDSYAPDVGAGISARDRAITQMLIALTSDRGAAVVQSFKALAASDASVGTDDFALHFLAGVMAAQLPRAYCEKLDQAVVGAHPRNRWALLMSGGLNTQLGHAQVALARYESLLTLPNQEPDGLWTLFRAWSYAGAAAVVKDSDPPRARKYVEAGLATSVTGGTRAGLLEMQKALSPGP